MSYTKPEDIKKNGFLIAHLENQTPDVCLIAVRQNGYALYYIEKQTHEICLAAVKQNGLSLQYVKNQTPDICIEAMKQNIYAMQYVKYEDVDILKYYLEILKDNGHMLQYINNQTEEMCILAVKQDGFSLNFVKNQTDKICLEAVKQNGMALELVKNQNLEICLTALKQTNKCFKFIDFAKFDFALMPDNKMIYYQDLLSDTTHYVSNTQDIITLIQDQIEKKYGPSIKHKALNYYALGTPKEIIKKDESFEEGMFFVQNETIFEIYTKTTELLDNGWLRSNMIPKVKITMVGKYGYMSKIQ